MQWTIAIVSIVCVGCSSPRVRSTVDAFGVEAPAAAAPVTKARQHFFVKNSDELLEVQAMQSCEQAARAAGIEVASADCPDCLRVKIQTRLLGTQQVIRATPGWGSSWGIFGAGGGMGVGMSSGGVSSRLEAGREIRLQVFDDAAMKKPLREIQVRSVGEQNSVVAVAYEMCAAGFQDYPANVSGKMYEVKLRE